MVPGFWTRRNGAASVPTPSIMPFGRTVSCPPTVTIAPLRRTTCPAPLPPTVRLPLSVHCAGAPLAPATPSSTRPCEPLKPPTAPVAHVTVPSSSIATVPWPSNPTNNWPLTSNLDECGGELPLTVIFPTEPGLTPTVTSCKGRTFAPSTISRLPFWLTPTSKLPTIGHSE